LTAGLGTQVELEVPAGNERSYQAPLVEVGNPRWAGR
jgi:hypothetical protein